MTTVRCTEYLLQYINLKYKKSYKISDVKDIILDVNVIIVIMNDDAQYEYNW